MGLGFFAGEGGAIYLNNPQGKIEIFHCCAIGQTYSFGIKLPKLPRINLPGSSSVGPASFKNAGVIFDLDGSPSHELTRSDITGGTLFFQIGAGLVAGVSGYVMLIGMNPLLLAAAIGANLANPFAVDKAVNSATAIMLMGGVNAGFQASYGASILIGGIV